MKNGEIVGLSQSDSPRFDLTIRAQKRMIRISFLVNPTEITV
uniref:Uncharacterized protein n=1 Tax=Candidatus Kentrum sp. LPFa TaxID=2126335 RepID=A0A450XVY8_9GAMM|nr:MAG: hypothetical protein BECKLPF1236A_GA0070988_102025 [Candidatus Kentron sp. LPFa]VFK33442.1 MAG: hypothetical protein BECKLPF1236C_GA0070990_102075 [Candidatus Kentron sp. LPFa]